MPPVSVCHHVSRTTHRCALRRLRNRAVASGLNGSPVEATIFRLDDSTPFVPSSPSAIMAPITDGVVYRVVTP